MPTGNGLRVGIFVFDGAEELDVVGPYEVLSYWASNSELHPEVVTFSQDGGGVRCAKGLRLVPDSSVADVGPLHVLVYPGGHGTRILLREPEHLAWVHEMRATTPLLTSVCTGALVYAAAGLLSGRSATTHWASLNLLAELEPDVVSDADARFIDDGDLVTSAGVSAGIDMALHLVARFAGTERAGAVQREIQYDPRPAA